MKKYSFFLLFIFVAFGCEKDSNRRSNNPYLPNYSFNAVLNLNLPSFNALLSNLNPIAVTVDGDIDILIMKGSDNQYYAWNGNCPNQAPTDCSKLTISGLNGKCNCEDAFLYNLFTGTAPNAVYPMINYRVEVLGNNSIRVYN
jgi:hypothetical protein